MKIIKLDVEKSFRYLWLKYVTGVNLSVHCAGSLKGEYSKRISPKTKRVQNAPLDEHDFKAVYFCGVACPYKWENNFHLALKESPGDTVDYESNGIHIVIQDAARIPISADHIDWNHAHAYDKAYNTCRNWQFANYIKSVGIDNL